MKISNKISLIFVIGILLCGFLSCSDDDDVEPKSDPAVLTDVKLTQTVNDTQALEINEKETEMTFLSQVVFNDKDILWATPTLEQSFSDVFTIEKGNVTLTDDKNTKITSANISVDDKNKVTIAFTKNSDSYDYMKSSTFKIVVKTAFKKDLTDDELITLSSTGYKVQSVFYADKVDQNIKSNEVLVTSKTLFVQPYSVKGDPNNNLYKSKLNVVYFVASDITPNPDFQTRISTLLLKHQLFVMKWMKHWGYEEKSFGLPLDETGRVEVVVVNGIDKKAAYPYDSSISPTKMRAEIEKHYKDNNLTWYSDHTLIVTATNEANGGTSETPFYGYGRWCYATDFEDMAYELYNIDPLTGEPMNSAPLKTNLLGGLLHELGHGMNAPHVGYSLSQINDSNYGTPLMGAGNTTYGKKPTFLHHTTAAIFNTNQLSATTDKKFYETLSGSVELEDPIINGENVTVKGSFTKSLPVVDVVIRFYNSTESHLGASNGYTSIAWVVKPNGNQFEATIPIKELSARAFKFKVGASVILDNGTTKNTTVQGVYRQENNTLVNESVNNDGTWVVTTSHPDYVENDKTFRGALIDGKTDTYMSLVKPGKSIGGITVPVGDQVWYVINFNKQTEYNTISIRNRNFQPFLNVKTVSFYGSNTNNGTDWTEITANVDLPNNTVNTITLATPANYQYLKMTYDKWESASGSAMQISEVEFLNIK